MSAGYSQKAIQNCYSFLEDNLTSLESLLGKCFEKGMIDRDKMLQIRRTTHPREQVAILLLECLSLQRINDLRKFCDILLESERTQAMYVHGEAARRLLHEIEKVEREGPPGAPEHATGPRPQSSSASSRAHSSASGTGGNWTFPNFPPGFPFTGGVPNIPPGTGTIISGNKIENSQINIVGSVSNSSLHFNRGNPYPQGPRPARPSGGGRVGGFQGQATPTSCERHVSGQPADDPHLYPQQSSDQEPRFDAKPTPEQFSTYVLSIIEGNVFEFYRELGVRVDDERDGGTSRDNMARVLRENPGISWRLILESLRRMDMADRASDLEKRIRFGSI